ncbi:MAG: alpha/beta hydrolase [Pseudomonadota bacterium]
MRRRRTILVVGAVMGVLVGLGIWRLLDHDLDRHTAEPLEFTVDGQTVAGTLWRPAGDPRAVVALVHGDGPQDRTSAGGYAPLINVLLDADLAVASWDKPGIGGSAGNWLDQSMEDRTAELRAALATLGGEGVPLGVLGFSQAGWVVPGLEAGAADFLVLVGAAVSWQRQGRYYTRTRLEREGLTPEAVDAAMADVATDNARLFGPDAQYDAGALGGLSEARWHFIRRNRNSDATAALGALTLPTLAVWGAEDLNVDPRANSAKYAVLLGERHPESRIMLIPEATHGLLKAGPYNHQLVENWPLSAKIRFLWEGRHAFAPGALTALTGWIDAQLSPPR